MKRLIFILTLTVLYGGQLVGQDRGSSEKDFTIDCSTVQAGASCRSFNELIKAKDKDILGHMQYGPVVCFLQDSDEFVLITTKHPPSESFHLASDGTSKEPGFELFARFKDGVGDTFRYVIGHWTKTAVADELQFTFDANPSSATELTIDDSEIEASFQFKNLNTTTTQYNIRIRRSTKRFIETYQFPDEPRAAQKGKAVPEKHANSRLEYTGYCAEFN